MRFLLLCRVDPTVPAADSEMLARQADHLGAPATMRTVGEDGATVLVTLDAADAGAARRWYAAAPFAEAGIWTGCEIFQPAEAPPPPAPVFDPDAIPAIRTVPMPADANPGGGVFGGWLLSQMDQAGGISAWRFAKGRCVSVAMDMVFAAPVRTGDEVSLYATLTGTGRSSMKIRIDAWARARQEEEIRHVGHAVFTFVAVDAEGKTRALPAVS